MTLRELIAQCKGNGPMPNTDDEYLDMPVFVTVVSDYQTDLKELRLYQGPDTGDWLELTVTDCSHLD